MGWGILGTALAVIATGAVLFAAVAKSSSQKPEDLRAERLEPRFERLKAMHVPKRPAQPGDWLQAHRERGQSFERYATSQPVRPDDKRHTLYLQPLGSFTKGESAALAAVADYVGRYFGLPVKTLEPLPLSVVPPSARRIHPSWGMEQILTSWVLDELLLPRRRPDALATIALTATDLYPEPSWNFVFGQASMRDRVGVWSMYRNGDADESPASYRLFLRRSIMTAVHELSHMISIEHCIAWECLMNGSNNREEADSRPLDLCPADLQKLCWSVNCDPVRRFERLAAFARENGLVEEERYFTGAARLVAQP